MLVDLVDAAEGGSEDDDYIGYCQNGVGHGYANDGADKYPHVEGVEVEKSDSSEGRGDYKGQDDKGTKKAAAREGASRNSVGDQASGGHGDQDCDKGKLEAGEGRLHPVDGADYAGSEEGFDPDQTIGLGRENDE